MDSHTDILILKVLTQERVAKIMMRFKEYRVTCMWVTKHIYLVGLY